MFKQLLLSLLLVTCSTIANSGSLFSDEISGTPGGMSGHTSAGIDVLIFDEGEAIIAKGRYAIFDDVSLSGYVLSQKIDPNNIISVEQTGFAIGVVAHQNVPFFKDIKLLNNMDFEVGVSIDRRKIDVDTRLPGFNFSKSSSKISNETLVSFSGELRNQIMNRLEVNAITIVCVSCNSTDSNADLSTFSLDVGARYNLSEGLFATSTIDIDKLDFIGFGLEYHFDAK